MKTAKIVYNACYGGFSLSHEAVLKLMEYKGVECFPKEIGLFDGVYTYYTKPWKGVINTDELPYFYERDIERHDPDLVRVVEELGPKANGMCADLRIEEVESGTLYRIDEYDGNESVVLQYNEEWKVAQ